MSILDAYGRQMQMAETPRPALTRELGAGGVSVIAGVLDDEEHVNALRGLDGVKIFDRMRRSDSEVGAVLSSLQLPILAADPVIDVPEDEELAGRITDDHLDFARRNVFELNDFQDTMRHMLSSMWAGYAWFEKTYSARDGRLWLDRLAPRLATTLWRWQVDDEGELTGIVQRVRKGAVVRDVPIPRDKLALFTFGKEANDWGGISALRQAYRNWQICDAVYKLDAIRIERYAVGVPVFKLTGEYTDDQVALLKEIGQNWRGAEQSYVILVGDMEFNLASMPSAQTLDVMPTIRHHNEQIAKSVLAQFINLGTTDSGSRALGESMMEFFYDAVEGHAKSYATQFNREILWPLMDLNFPGSPRPELRLENIGSVALPMLADGLAKLQGYVNWDEDTEEFVRKRFGLPPRTATSPPQKPTAPVMVELPEVTLPPVGAPKGSGTQVQSLVFSKERFTESQAKKWAADHGFRSSAVDETDTSWRLRQFDPEHCRLDSFGQRDLDKGVQAVFCDVGERASKPATVRLRSSEFWRPLTDVEKHVRLRQIDARLDDGRDAIVSALLDLREEIAEDLVGEIRRAWKDGPAGFAEVSVPERTVERTTKAVVPELEELYDFGRQEVRRELARQSKAKGHKLTSKQGNVRTATILRRQAIALRDEGLTPDEIGELMAYRAGKLATRLADKTMESALAIAAGRWRTEGGNEPTGKALDDIMEAVFSSVEREARLVANMTSSEALNLGRDFEAQRLKEQIELAQYSSILDDNSCTACRQADGEETKVGTDEYYDLTPPLNSSRLGPCEGAGACRCIWVYVIGGLSDDREELWRDPNLPLEERLTHYKPGDEVAAAVIKAEEKSRQQVRDLREAYGEASKKAFAIDRQIGEAWTDGKSTAELEKLHDAALGKAKDLYQRLIDAVEDRNAKGFLARAISKGERESLMAWSDPDMMKRAEARKSMNFVSGMASAAEWQQLKITLEVDEYVTRAYAAKPARVVVGPEHKARDIAHEIGHVLEHAAPQVNKAANDFRQYRTRNENPINLAEKFVGYGKDERGAKDKFDVAWKGASVTGKTNVEYGYYTGKAYAGGSTEIMSMGLELMWQDAAGFAQRDPEWFKFMVMALRGDL